MPEAHGWHLKLDGEEAALGAQRQGNLQSSTRRDPSALGVLPARHGGRETDHVTARVY